MPLVFTRLGISCFTMIDIIPMFFLIFLRFQKMTLRAGALETVDWSPATNAKFAVVLTLDYMSEEDSNPKHPQRKRTITSLAWESCELRVLKRQLDEHETAVSMVESKGVRQPVERDQADRLSDLQKTCFGMLLIERDHKGTLDRNFLIKSAVDSPK